MTLGLDHIELLQLHRIDPNYSTEAQIGELARLKQEGKIKRIGLSQVSAAQLEEAQQITPIASVQNRYNLSDRTDEDVLNYADAHHIAFIPWFPLATGGLTKGTTLQKIADVHHSSPAQIALAWLLKRSNVILPIPGTSNPNHVVQNIAAQDITLSETEFQILDQLGKH